MFPSVPTTSPHLLPPTPGSFPTSLPPALASLSPRAPCSYAALSQRSSTPGRPCTRAVARSVFSLVEPEDVRWVFLSHDDGDHMGNLHELLELRPNATSVTNFFVHKRQTLERPLPVTRMRWLGSRASPSTLAAAAYTSSSPHLRRAHHPRALRREGGGAVGSGLLRRPYPRCRPRRGRRSPRDLRRDVPAAQQPDRALAPVARSGPLPPPRRLRGRPAAAGRGLGPRSLSSRAAPLPTLSSGSGRWRARRSSLPPASPCSTSSSRPPWPGWRRDDDRVGGCEAVRHGLVRDLLTVRTQRRAAHSVCPLRGEGTDRRRPTRPPVAGVMAEAVRRWSGRLPVTRSNELP